MKKNRNKKWIIAVCILLLLAAGVYICIHMIFGKMTFVEDSAVIVDMEALETETEKNLTAAELYDRSGVTMPSDEMVGDTVTLLVIGGSSPEAEENGSREDAKAIILMTINHDLGEVFFHTLHKDLYVDIPDTDGHHLANAYAVGGGPLLAETIEENFGIRIDNYAAVSMGDVARIIEMPDFENLDVSRDGIEVIEEMLLQLGAVKATQVAGYISNVLPYVTHNLTSADLMNMILQIPRVVGYYSEKYAVPEQGEAREIEGYQVVNANEVSDTIQTRIYYRKPENDETEMK